MRNVFTVARFEIRSLLGKPSFWLLTVLFPAFIVVLTAGGQLMAGSIGEEAVSALISQEEAASLPDAIGYVDHSGLIQTLPPQMPSDLVRPFADETSAQAALAAGEIQAYYIIAAGFIETGQMTLVQREFQPFGETNEGLVEYILNYNLTGDAVRAALLGDPLPSIEYQPLIVETADGAETAPAPGPGGALGAIVPLAAVMLLFFILVMSSGYMLRSVSREKENLTVEILLLSLRPRQLMLGKILGLSVVALLQMILWLAAGMLFLDRGGSLLQMVGSIQLPPAFIAWTLAYVVLGYLLYASLMGALGALAPTAREANQFSFVILLPLMIPLWLNSFLAQAPNGTLALVLSLFPLTAPPAMIARLAATDVPLWQPVLGLVLLALTTYGAILLSARFFRADTLLSTTSLDWRRIFQAARQSA